MGGEAPPQHLRCTFDGAAAIYHEARPAYPAKLFDDLIELADLKPGARLLEVGCGTGKATLPLASRGYAVVCVELGANLADQARANLADYPVEIDVAPFETWAGDDGSFDLVYAATAWRWIDPTVRYAKARALLRPAGHLAFWNAAHAFPADVDPFFADIQAVYDEIGESHTGEWPPLPPDLTPADTDEITATGLFEHVQVRRYPVPIRSDSQPKSSAPTIRPAKNTELISPAWLEFSPNSCWIAGRTAGRIPPSTAVIRMAPVVTASVTQDSGCARGIH